MIVFRDVSTRHRHTVCRPEAHSSSVAWQVWVMLKRNLIRVRRRPETLMQLLLQPIAFMLFFTFIVGRSISENAAPHYREYLLPGIQAQAIVATIILVGAAISADVENDVFIRFRSLPISNSAPLIARGLVSLLYAAIVYILIGISGMLIGWRMHGSLADAVLAFVLVLVFGVGFMWLGMVVGLMVRTVEVVGAAVFLITLPIISISNCFVPTQPMPHALRVIAEWNPLSSLALALRKLTIDEPMAPPSAQLPLHHPALSTLIYSIVLTALLAPIAIRAYIRRTSL
ncbi:ABC transporter permease [Mycobacterium marinum]|uniref:ABC transporter permease n=1 Tax=Mycobacterium marinum TaxID=1781 RepID=UPI00056A000E|nr:ABC transporter permease [Mycobacterium marinum]MDC8975420.1 ABC transporter permease [Mycobacterium marinum]MDC9007910.1 ABC transporter permease [Mycobacterium marinum]